MIQSQREAAGARLDEQAPGSLRSISPEDPPARSRLRTRVLTTLVVLAAGLTLLLAVPALRDVIPKIGDMSAPWVMLAIALELASCLSFVVIFRHFFARLSRRLAGELAWTEMGSGALLPGGGVGSLAIGGWLLHLVGMPTELILRRSSALFFLTSATSVFVLIGGGLLIVTGASPNEHVLALGWLPVAVGVGAVAAVMALPWLVRDDRASSKRLSWVADLIAGVRETESFLRHPNWRLLGALGYLCFDIAVLWATFRAVGYSPALATLVLGYTIGYLANLLPIPGGVGVLEGGLVGTLVLYGAPLTQTTAAVLVYHAIAFWIPSLGGLAAYRQVRRRLAGGGPKGPAPLAPVPDGARPCARRVSGAAPPKLRVADLHDAAGRRPEVSAAKGDPP